MATDAFVLDQIDDINDRLSVLGFGYKFEEESLVESNDQWKAICSSILSELRQDQTISISDLHTWCESRGHILNPNARDILDCLTTELQVSRMENYLSNQKAIESTIVPMESTDELIEQLRFVLEIPEIPNLDDFITVAQEKLHTSGSGMMDMSLFSDQQLETIREINQMMHRDYSCRHDLLLKRANVTIQSFLWSKRGKDAENEIKDKIAPLMEEISTFTPVSWQQVFMVDENSLGTEYAHPPSSKSLIKSIIIGEVPDRGGRVNDARVPPPTLRNRPQTGARSSSNTTNRERGRGRGRGRVQGSWQTSQKDGRFVRK